jgi:hypothetical protein
MPEMASAPHPTIQTGDHPHCPEQAPPRHQQLLNMKTKAHWMLSLIVLCLLGWQVNHLLQQGPLMAGHSAYGVQTQSWFAHTDVVIALLAATLFVTLLLTPSRQS